MRTRVRRRITSGKINFRRRVSGSFHLLSMSAQNNFAGDSAESGDSALLRSIESNVVQTNGCSFILISIRAALSIVRYKIELIERHTMKILRLSSVFRIYKIDDILDKINIYPLVSRYGLDFRLQKLNARLLF